MTVEENKNLMAKMAGAGSWLMNEIENDTELRAYALLKNMALDLEETLEKYNQDINIKKVIVAALTSCEGKAFGFCTSDDVKRFAAAYKNGILIDAGLVQQQFMGLLSMYQTSIQNSQALGITNLQEINSRMFSMIDVYKEDLTAKAIGYFVSYFNLKKKEQRPMFRGC